MNIFELKNKPIIVFGAGDYGVATLKMLNEYGITPLTVLDNDTKKAGGELLGVSVQSPADFEFSPDMCFVIGSTTFLKEIKAQLITKGISEVLITTYEELAELVADDTVQRFKDQIAAPKEVADRCIRILYDGQIFSDQKRGGISRYYCEVMHGISNDADFAVDFFGGLGISELDIESTIKNGANANYIKAEGLVSEIPHLRKNCNRILTKAYTDRIKKADIYHPAYYWDMGVSNYGKMVVTVYDMIHELFLADDVTKSAKKHVISQADGIIAISDNTKRDLMKIFNKDENKISVIHLANSLHIKVKDDRLIAEPYILFVGNRGYYKNFKLLAKAFAKSKLNKGMLLLCFGGGTFTKDEKELLHSLRIEECTRQCQGDDVTLANLYYYADLFVYPSAYEGFGLPILEAMYYKTPVLTANISSMPEVGGDAAAYFEADSEEDLITQMETLMDSPDRRKEFAKRGVIREKQFSWDKCVRETAEFYRRIL